MSASDPGSAFVGREHPMAGLLADAEGAAGGAARAVLVCADAGVGKTRLIEEYLGRTPLRSSVVGACVEMGAETVGFVPFVAILRRLVREHRPTDGEARELARLLPELGEASTVPDDGRSRLFESVLTFLESCAEPEAGERSGLVVAIEDLHWADASTLDLAGFLLRNLGPAPVQFVLTVRTDDLHRTHPLRRLLPELERLAGVSRLDLGTLNRAEVAAQAAALRGDSLPPEDVDELFTRSGGNPLFVESLLSGDGLLSGQELPEGPRDLLLRAVEELPATTRKVLGLAATAGAGVDHELLAAAADRSGIGEDALDQALRQAIDARVLYTTPSGYVFRHALLAEAVRTELMPGERIRAHRRLADALEGGVPGIPAEEATLQLAHHARSAHDHARALAATWRAAEDADRAFGYPERLALLERALELWELSPDTADELGVTRAELLQRAAHTAHRVGRIQRTADHSTEGLAELGADGPETPEGLDARDAETAAFLRLRRAKAYKDLGQEGELTDLAIASVLLPKEHVGHIAIDTARSASLMVRGREEEAGPIARTVLERARRIGDRHSEADALISLGSFWWRDEEGSRRALLHQGIALARENGQVGVELRGWNNLNVSYLFQLDRENALATARRKLERCEELGLLRTRGQDAAVSLAIELIDWGRTDEAGELLARFRHGEEGSELRRLTLRILLHTWEGELTWARRAVEELVRLRPMDGLTANRRLSLNYTRLRLLLAEGRLTEATTLARTIIAEERRKEPTQLSLDGVVHLSELVHHLRRSSIPEHHPLARELLPEVDLFRRENPWLATPFGRYLLLESRAWLSTHPPEARQLWVDRAAWGRDTGMYVRAFKDLCQAARAAQEADDTDGVRDLLARAEETAALCDNGDALIRYHVTPQRLDSVRGRPVSTPPAGLTSREAEVLAELAQGRTNREIGEALFISAKTVSVHVTNLMGKLGVTNRNAAAVRAREVLDLR